MTKIISREIAITKGLTRYFTGIPCKYGHISERMVKSYDCIGCRKNPKRVECRRKYIKKYQQGTKHKKYQRQYYLNIINNAEEWPRKAILEIRHRAKERNLEFNIEVSDIIVPEICPVLNIPIILGKGRNNPNAPSIDRIDNSKGYTKNNIRVISLRANHIKNNATVEELEKILKYMKEYNLE